MNGSNTRRIAPIALALALAFTGATALADSTSSDSSSGGFFNSVTYSANAWHKTKDFFAPKPDQALPNEPQRYGRAGGYVGAEQIAYLNSGFAPTAPSQPEVKSGDSKMNYESTHGTAPAPSTSADNSMSGNAAPPQEPHSGRTEGGRFDNPDGTRGQNENGG